MLGFSIIVLLLCYSRVSFRTFSRTFPETSLLISLLVSRLTATVNLHGGVSSHLL